MKNIEHFVEYLDCPILNGIIFPNGIVKKIDIEVIQWSPKICYFIKGIENSSIQSLEEQGDLYWTSCCIMARQIVINKSIEVISGEAFGNGEYGFVGVIDLNSRKTIWLAFFESSNPFNQLDIKDDEIYATSTYNCLWRFKLNNPLDFIIESC